MPSLSLPGQLIWFAHCPKAGGTSVEHVMVSRWGDAVGHLHWGWDLWWRDGGWRLASPPNSPQHLAWEDVLSQLPKAPDVIFTVVRDPVSRMASEHRWQRRGRRGTRLGKALAFLPFPLWLRIMLAVARRNRHAFDNHFRPQVDFVPEGARVFHLEEGLAPVMNWLAEQTSCAVGDVIPHALSTGPAPRIDPGSRTLIAQSFADDFTRFGYALPPVSHKGPTWMDRLAEALAPLVAGLDRRGRL